MRMRMVRPSAASLNSLAGMLRQAQPLYDECRSILNYLESGEGKCGCVTSEEMLTPFDSISANKDGIDMGNLSGATKVRELKCESRQNRLPGCDANSLFDRMKSNLSAEAAAGLSRHHKLNANLDMQPL